jgi:shikimate kinase
MNITLIGMAGAGKSVIGKALAKKLGYRFIDTDKIIERTINMKLYRIIEKLGEEKFLRMEEVTIRRLKIDRGVVISPGGSIIYSPRAMAYLKKHSRIVFLETSLANINRRVKNKSRRGIVGLKKKGFKGVFEERKPLYKKYADVSIRLGSDYSISCVIKKIINAVEKKP